MIPGWDGNCFYFILVKKLRLNIIIMPVENKQHIKHQETIDYFLKVVWQTMANRYNQLVAEFGITQSIGYLLINIDEKEGTTVSQAASLLGLKSTSLSRMLSQLEKM